MLLHIQKIIEDMGWSDGYHIPVANKENLELEAEIERLTLAKAKATLAYDAVTSKCTALKTHLKHVQTEQEQNQTLLLARYSELNAERDLYLLTKTEKENTIAEIKSFNKEYEKVEERKQTKLKDLNKVVSKLDNLKASIEWDEHSINDWEDKLLKKHGDNDIIKKFSEEDKKRAKDLEIKRQRLQEEFNVRKQLVIKTTKETDSLQLILTRNVQLYKQMHEERSALLKQWQEAVKNLQQRDKDTLSVNREIITIKELIEAKEEILAQEKQFHQNEINNNAELEVEIQQSNGEIAKLRKDIQNNHQLLGEYNMEYEAMKRELKRTADMLECERVTTKNLFNDLLHKEKVLHNATLHVQQLKVQEKNVQDSGMTSNERIRQLEQIIQGEETTHKGLLVEVENMQHTIFRSQKLINELEEFHKLKNLLAQGHEQGIHLLDKEKIQVDKEILNYKEQAYKINFKLAMLMSRITRMEGNGGAEDYEDDYQKKVEELEAKWKQINELSNLLQSQINTLEELMRSLTTATTADNDTILKMKNKLQEQVLLVEGAVKLQQTKKNLNHQHQVEENVLNVRLKHAEKQLQNEGNTIYNLQRQHIELETMMRERESEIAINREILIAKKNALQEDLSRMRHDIQGRQMKTEILKKRLDAVLSTLGKTDDGENFSVAYFKVKAAQEKFMLQEEGDKLDNLIRNAEKEIIAMENTLKAVNISNASVKKSLSVVNEPDDEIAEMKQLENEQYAQTKLLRQNRNQLVSQQEKLLQIQELLDNKLEKIEELQKQISEKEGEHGLLKNEAFHRKTKMERTEKLIKKVLNKKEIDALQERDFIIRQLQDFNRSAMQQLSETMVRYRETKPTINHYLAENKLSLSLPSLRSSPKSYSSLSYSSATNRSAASIPSVSLTFDAPK